MSKWLWKNILVYGKKQSWLEYLGGFIAYIVVMLVAGEAL